MIGNLGRDFPRLAPPFSDSPSRLFAYALFVYFFFKQKTAYELSECDCSSDVCSSDPTLFRSQAEDGIRISECDWSSDVCSSDPALKREMRSNHAGEPGAVWIYRGVLAITR